MTRLAQELELNALRRHVEKLQRERAARSDLVAELIADFTSRYRRDRRPGDQRSDVELHTQSPLGWLKMPISLWRAYARRQRGDVGARPRASDRKQSISLEPEANLLVPLTLGEQRVTVRASHDCREIWVTPLCADPAGLVTMQLGAQATHSGRLAHFVGEAGVQPDATDTTLTLTIRLFAGERKRLLWVDGEAAEVALTFRRLRGELCVLKFELSSGQVTGATAASSGEEARSTRAGGGMANRHRFGRPMAGDTLWRAQEMAREGRATEAVEFALAHASETERPAVNLLQALLAKHDENAWLWHVNQYVEQFAIAPIRLMTEGPSRFARLSAPVARVVSRGPLVSVVMTAFNAERTLEFAAASILSQTWQPLELIIIDDCSRDMTWEIARKIASSDARVKLRQNAVNVGPYVSKNLALSMARGEYITCHDADDWAHPERIEKQIETMLADGPEIKASVGGMVRIDETGEFDALTRIGETSHDGALRLAPVSCMFAADFMRRHVGHWDSVRFGADGEMIHRVRHILGQGFVWQRQLLMFCLDAQNSLTNDPAHGISRTHGLSHARRSYRDHWRAWHSSIDLDSAYLPFPHERRRFDAPHECVVPVSSIERVLNDS